MALITPAQLDAIKQTAQVFATVGERNDNLGKLDPWFLEVAEKYGSCTHIVIDAHGNQRCYTLVLDDTKPFIEACEVEVCCLGSSGPSTDTDYYYRELGLSFRVHKEHKGWRYISDWDDKYPTEWTPNRLLLTDEKAQRFRELRLRTRNHNRH